VLPHAIPDDRRVSHIGAAPLPTAGTKRKASGRVAMPKRPVNAYNYFSMEYRQGLRGAKREGKAAGGGARSSAGEEGDEKGETSPEVS
jgi:hypothetical protein